MLAGARALERAVLGGLGRVRAGRGAVRREWRGLAVMAWLVVAASVRAMGLALVVAVRLGERRRVRHSVGKVATSWALAFVNAVR